VCMCAMALLAGCGESGPSIAKGPLDANSDVVSFAPNVPYAGALRLLTDAGTQPAIDCGSFHGGQSRVGWQPQGQRAAFARDHRLFVRPSNPFSPLYDWEQHLPSGSGVMAVQPGTPVYPDGPSPTPPAEGLVPYACPPLLPDPTPPARTPVALGAGEAGLVPYARVAFAASATYDDALYAVSDLGLRLADPCFEAAAGRADPAHRPAWRSPGQEGAFAATRRLVVAPNKHITSSLWQAALRATPGVLRIEAPYATGC